MWRLMLCICLVAALWVSIPFTYSENDLSQLLVSDDGLISLRVPQGWYLSTETSENRTLLVAAPTAERAADIQGEGEPLFHLYADMIPNANINDLLQSTLKNYGFAGASIEESRTNLVGIEAVQYNGQHESRQIRLLIAQLPESDIWLRFIATGSHVDSAIVEEVQASIIILPQLATTPRGWTASMRAPLGWEENGYSSFIQWKAPGDSPFEGMEVWFQAGLRSDLVGDGEPVFVLQSLGIMYATQVNETTLQTSYLAGLEATRVHFESFTHTGFTINVVSSSDFGTANLVARAPLGTWTPAHDALVEAMVASVQITPPTAEDAPVGLRQGYRAPDFAGILRDGTPFSLANYTGKLVFVHFWFVDCPYCRVEWPHVQAVYDEYQDEGMVILAVNAIDSESYIDNYFESADLDVPVVMDDGALHEQFNVVAFPTTFVIGPDGVIVSTSRGPMSEKNMRYLVEEYLLNH